MKSLALLVLVLWSSYAFAQNGVRLLSSSKGEQTIDKYKKGANSQYFEQWTDAKKRKLYLNYVSVPPGEQVTLTFKIDTARVDATELSVSDLTTKKVLFSSLEGDKLIVTITGTGKNRTLSISSGTTELSRLGVRSYAKQREQIVIVPLLTSPFQSDSIRTNLEDFFEAANLEFDLKIDRNFRLKSFPEDRLFRNPSEAHERYTSEMRFVRDAYLKKHPDVKSEYLFFIIPGFKNDSLGSYIVKNKALGFVKTGSNQELSSRFIAALGFSIAGIELETRPVPILNNLDWKNLSTNSRVYQLFDDYEDIPASTGLVAYYFWKENSLGNIELPEGGTKNPMQYIVRPYKRNTFSYHLQLDHFFVKTIFSIKGIPFNLLHLLTFIGALFSGYFFGRWLRRWIRNKWRFPRLFRILSLPAVGFGTIIIGYVLFLLVNLVYTLYEVKAGQIDELNGMTSVNALVQRIQSNQHPRLLAEKRLESEILVSHNETTELRQRDPVLYFEALLNEKGKTETLRLIDSKKTLNVDGIPKSVKALNHYFVIRYKNSDGTLKKEEVYNFGGVRITQNLTAKDPVKRILVFVNGYRPTSLGSDFQEHFSDIQKNGLEFPNSQNHVYSFDRYNYWNPWNQMDQRFVQHFMPTDTYYADGHFSVTTSNYRSLINFTTTSSKYPKRCEQGKKHHCYRVSSVSSRFLGTSRKKTLSMINYRSNRSGFNQRRENGRVAGRNLYHALNELPNRSKNDTVYIVAHSMGYAYALGIIDELRGKINFGSLIIIAPENAGAGKVNAAEWQEIWQYGSRRKTGKDDAPCLQDGVAPQVLAKGLSYSKRVFIPGKYYKRKGFFDSHFIGYYTWIFDIPEKQKGHLKKH